MNWDVFSEDDWRVISVIQADTDAQKALCEELSDALEQCWSLPYAALSAIQEMGYVIVPKGSADDPR